MAKEQLEPEVISIFEAIDAGDNFLLSGGAGSGKTYSLVQVIKEAIIRNPKNYVACMTYTNAAVKEIEGRVNHPNLKVTTIHDFFWDCIKSFQKELKKSVIDLLNDEDESSFTISTGVVDQDYYNDLEKGIQYEEWVSLKDGIISHDELIYVAERMFSRYSLLCDILKDKYKFIFIDEYQDTSELVVKIFLEHLKKSKKKNIIGFFGDAMQSIYDNTIGNLDHYKGDEPGKVKEIKKEQNRRNPKSVIDLANLLRTDGLIQIPSTDPEAPNMKDGIIKNGNILFIHSEDGEIEKVKEYLHQNHGWSFDLPQNTKELNLTHNLIADKAGFRNLMDIYDKDQILAYKNRIRKYIKDKKVDTNFTGMSFGQVIQKLVEGKTGKDLAAVKPTNGMQNFINDNLELYDKAQSYSYESFSKLYIDKDQLIDDKKQQEDDEKKKGSKRDNLIRHLMKIQNCIMLYKQSRFNEFLRTSNFNSEVKSIVDKKRLRSNIEKLINVGDKTIEEIIQDAHDFGIAMVDDRVKDFRANRSYLYDRVREVKFSEFQKLYDYLEGKTPFST